MLFTAIFVLSAAVHIHILLGIITFSLSHGNIFTQENLYAQNMSLYLKQTVIDI